MAVRYANSRCITCGRRITIRAPQYDAGKPPHCKTGQTIEYDDLQIEHAKRCRTCSKRVARTVVASLRLPDEDDDYDR
jgi:DNA-directed RNA polymerase subunit RPC12/RpoP